MSKKLTEEEKRLRRNEYLRKYRSTPEQKEKEKIKAKKYRSTPEYKEKHRIEMAEWRKNNPEKQLEIRRKNYKLHGAKQNLKRKERRENDEDYRNKLLEKDRQYTKSGRRIFLYHNNPNKNEWLKNKWTKIKANNHEKILAYSREYRKNTLIHKERESRNNLSDEYVKLVIRKQLKYKIKSKEIPKELIELKRNTIKVKRIIKNKKDEA